MKRMAFVRALALAVSTALLASATRAQDYPSRPVKILVPSAPGSGADTTARSVSKVLAAVLGQPFVVETKPGGQGLTAEMALIASKPDGYTLIMASSSHSALPSLYHTKYDAIADFTPIARVAIGGLMLVVNPKVPAKTMRELIELARKSPGKLSYGFQGTAPQVAGAMFAKVAGLDLLPVPFSGPTQAMTDVIAGRVTMMFIDTRNAKAQVDGGKLVALAYGGKKRAGAFPDVATVAEQGYPGYDVEGWFGLMGPKDLPRPIVDKLNGALKDHYIGKSGQNELAAAGLDPASEGPEEFLAFMKADIKSWSQMISDAKIEKRLAD